MRLMISVVSAAEARKALLGGAEILDIKNPAEGSLGAQPPARNSARTKIVPANFLSPNSGADCAGGSQQL
jgi:(5-formylfuran-3-yl)methyl phosphate synthase